MALPVLRRNRQNTGIEQANESTRRSGSSVERWTPWAELAELHERMGRLLTEAFGPGVGEVLGAAALSGGWQPAADVEETDDAYLIELELPGVQRDDVSVEFGGGELSVTGEVKQQQRVGLLRTRTRPMGRFDYRISLPLQVQEDQVTASLADGVLTVRMPKTEQARRRKIAISTG
jgi:HSP20 family protein